MSAYHDITVAFHLREPSLGTFRQTLKLESELSNVKYMSKVHILSDIDIEIQQFENLLKHFS